MSLLESLDLQRLEGAVWIASARTGIPSYDFTFEPLFATSRWFGQPAEIQVVGRFGARPYRSCYDELAAAGIRLVHSPEQHFACADLRGWYPILQDLTPKSLVVDEPTESALAEVAGELGFPVFVKGARQTHRHRASTAIAHDAGELKGIVEQVRSDPVLGWQTMVCREWVVLRHVQDWNADRIAASFEFRAFFWRRELVGFGRYWVDAEVYVASSEEREAAVRVAQAAVDRVDAVFVVVDVAQAEDGRWLVIECNDGQESGYAGCDPREIWRKVVARELRDG